MNTIFAMTDMNNYILPEILSYRIHLKIWKPIERQRRPSEICLYDCGEWTIPWSNLKGHEK